MNRAVRNILPFDFQTEFLSIFLEFPGVQSTRIRIADVNAVVVQKILRLPGLSITLKIIWCSNNKLAPVLAYFCGNHIIIQNIARTNPGIKTLINNICKSIVNADFNLNIWVATQKVR